MKNKGSQSSGRIQPSSEDVSAAVEAIITSGVLGKSERRERLLRYLVEHELSGKGEEIKAFTIATDVFGRDASFEASTDSIVRSEIGRLRDALKLFFAESEDNGLVRIDIPKGTYRPTFTINVEQDQKARRLPLVATLALLAAGIVLFTTLFLARSEKELLSTEWPVSIAELPYEVVRVSVVPFESEGNNPAAADLAFGMSSELIMDLSAFPWMSVISSRIETEAAKSGQADYLLTGSILWNDAALTTHAELVSLPERNVIWSDNFTTMASPETITQAVIEISSRIAGILGSMHGVTPQLAKSRSAQVSEEGLDALLCYLRLPGYLMNATDAGHAELRECLTETLEEFPRYGDAWAALAIIQMDEQRFGRNPRSGADPWQDAAHSVSQALVYAPTRMTSLNAAIIHSVEGGERNEEAFERYAGLLLNLYPRHPASLYNVGSRMVEFNAGWDKGLALVDQALALEPNPPSFYHLPRAYKYAVFGSDEEAWTSAQKLTSQTSKSELLLRLLAAARNGFFEEMAAERLLLAQVGLPEKVDLEAHIRGRGYTPALETALLAQLDQAFQDHVPGE